MPIFGVSITCLVEEEEVEWSLIRVPTKESNGSLDSWIMETLIGYCTCSPFGQDAEVDVEILVPSTFMI